MYPFYVLYIVICLINVDNQRNVMNFEKNRSKEILPTGNNISNKENLDKIP